MSEPVLGPVLLLYGNPITALGAGMKYIGHTNGDVVLSLNLRSSAGRTDQTGGAPLHDGAFDLGPDPRITIPSVEYDPAVLIEVLLGGEYISGSGGGVLNFGAGVKKVTPGTLCVLPMFERELGLAAPHAIWIPSAQLENLGDFIYRLPQGDDATAPHSMVFKALYREVDQDDNEIPEDGRILMMGDPTDNGLPWLLPATAGNFAIGS